MVAIKETLDVTARVMFGHTIILKDAPPECTISVAADGSDSIQEVKAKISASVCISVLITSK